jgi:hypothetical protein
MNALDGEESAFLGYSALHGGGDQLRKLPTRYDGVLKLAREHG